MNAWQRPFATTAPVGVIKSTPCPRLSASYHNWDGVKKKIGKDLGMDNDEVLRLRQINGLQELFADRRFSKAWTVK